MKFAEFEERCREFDRARTIYKFALDHIPKGQAQGIYKEFIAFEKKHGDREGIEDVIIGKYRYMYICKLYEAMYVCMGRSSFCGFTNFLFFIFFYFIFFIIYYYFFLVQFGLFVVLCYVCLKKNNNK